MLEGTSNVRDFIPIIFFCGRGDWLAIPSGGGKEEGKARERWGGNTFEASADGFSNVPKRSLAFLRSTSLTF